MEKKSNTSQYEKNMFYFILIDILFLPYIRILSVKASMIALIYWYLRGGMQKALTKKSFNLFFLFVILSITSILIGIVYTPQGYSIVNILLSNVQSVVITWFSFLFLYYFKYQFSENNFEIDRFLLTYLLFALVFAILFWINPQMYFDIRQFWTLDNQRTIFIHHTINRFTHIVSEPNNFSIVVIGIMTYFRFVEKYSTSRMLIIYLISLFLIITTMSTTGMVLYVFYFAISITFRKTYNVKLKNMLILTVLIIMILVFTTIFKEKIEMLFNSVVFNTAFQRYEGYFESENYSGSRVDIWIQLLSEVNILEYIFIGRGTTILSNGRLYKPHNGHFLLIYGYGMIAYIVFFYEFFRYRTSMLMKNYFVIVLPFLIIFTMNTLIGDLRSMLFYIILLGSILDSKLNKNMRSHILYE